MFIIFKKIVFYNKFVTDYFLFVFSDNSRHFGSIRCVCSGLYLSKIGIFCFYNMADTPSSTKTTRDKNEKKSQLEIWLKLFHVPYLIKTSPLIWVVEFYTDRRVSNAYIREVLNINFFHSSLDFLWISWECLNKLVVLGLKINQFQEIYLPTQIHPIKITHSFKITISNLRNAMEMDRGRKLLFVHLRTGIFFKCRSVRFVWVSFDRNLTKIVFKTIVISRCGLVAVIHIFRGIEQTFY